MACVGVCGSVNMDVFGYVPRLPSPGETLRGTRLAYAPGGKGANQAVAAARVGAAVRFTSACGRDDFGDELTAALEGDGVDLTGVRRVDLPTGVAIILVDDAGENQIAVIPGANDAVEAPAADPEVDVWLVQAEVPIEAVEGTLAAARATGATAVVNPSPAGRIPPALVARYDIAIVNETELEALGDEHPPHVVLTLGSRGVRILPEDIALPAIPARVVDTTGAGMRSPAPQPLRSPRGGRSRRRWSGGSRRLRSRSSGTAASRPCRGAMRSKRGCGSRIGMTASPIPIVLDCDPGHDDAIAIMVALGSPEVELRAVTTVAGNAPLHRTTANAIRVLDFLGRADIPVAAGADRPLVQPAGDHGDVHGETGLDGPDLPPPAREPVPAHAVDVIAEFATSSGPADHACGHRAAHQRGPAGRAPPGGGRRARAGGHHGRLDRPWERHAGGRVQHLGRSRRRPAHLHERARRHDGRPRRDPEGPLHGRAERPPPGPRPGRAGSPPNSSTTTCARAPRRPASRSTTPWRWRRSSSPAS